MEPRVSADPPEPPPVIPLKGNVRRYLWGFAPVLLLIAVSLVSNYGSGEATNVAGVQVHCEGFTRIDPDACAPWAQEILDQQIPDSISVASVSRLEIKRALFGLWPQCSVEYSFNGGSGERSIPCR